VLDRKTYARQPDESRPQVEAPAAG